MRDRGFENAASTPCLWYGTAQVAVRTDVQMAEAPNGVVVMRYLDCSDDPPMPPTRIPMAPEQARALAAALIAAADTIEKGKP